MTTRAMSFGLGVTCCQSQSASWPTVAWAASAASRSGSGLPSSANGSRSNVASDPVAKGGPDARSAPRLPAFQRTASVVEATSSIGGLREDAFHPLSDLVRRGRFLGHSVRQVAPQPIGAVFEDGGDQRVLRGEVAVEGLVRQAGGGDDVAHPRARGGAAPAHDLEAGVEQPPHLVGIALAPFGQRPLGDADGHVVRDRSGRGVGEVGIAFFAIRTLFWQLAGEAAMWDFETEPEFQEKLDWVDAFVRDEIEPLDLVWGGLEFTPLDETRRRAIDPLKDEVRKRELWATHLGPEFGGQGYGQLKLALLNEILGRSSWAPIVFGCQAPDTGNAEIIAHYGTPEQKERYLRPLLDGELFSCYSMTEPHAGADPTMFTTRAERDGDEWVINGWKFFSSNARTASFLIVMVVTNPEISAYQGMSMFLVPTDTPGVNIVRNVGLAGEPEGEGSHALIHYDNVRVPVEALLGGEGQAFAIAQTRLGGGRIHHAMRTIGIAKKALDMMCERALSRTTQGSILADKQFVQGYIADSYAQLVQFRLFVLYVAWSIDKHNDYRKVRKDIATAKVVMPTVLHDIAWRAMQVHGALGVSNEMPFLSMILGAGVMGLADGPTEVHKVTVARQVLRDYRPSDDMWPTQHIPRLREAARAKLRRVPRARGGEPVIDRLERARRWLDRRRAARRRASPSSIRFVSGGIAERDLRDSARRPALARCASHRRPHPRRATTASCASGASSRR